jgi:hypothetical protein
MISTTTSQVSHTGNNSTSTAYAFSFPLASASDLVAISRVTSTGVETTLTSGQFTVTTTTDANGRITGGSVTTNPAIPATSTLILRRVTPKTQTLDFTAGGAFQAEAVESALDRIVMISQENARDFAAADTLLDARLDVLEA